MATTPEQVKIVREFCEKLRCNPKTLDVVCKVFAALPDDHKFIFTNCMEDV